MEHVVLVNEADEDVGTMEKMEAHQKGILHRAFSILIFNTNGEMLLQKRAKSKYHSSSLWTNACCSHPLPGESLENATRRKLQQEIGIDVIPEFVFKFKYKASLDKGLSEHEFDHVFIGRYDGEPVINPKEVEDWKFISVEDLFDDMERNPANYTEWFKLILAHPEFRVVV